MTRGGKREGAGRKTISETGPVKRFTVAIPVEVIEGIKQKAEAAGVSQARLIALAVAAFEPGRT